MAIRWDEFLANIERYKRVLPPDEPIVLPKRETKRRAANKEKRTRVVFECTPEQFAAFHAQLKRYRELVGNVTMAMDIMIGYLAHPQDEQILAVVEEQADAAHVMGTDGGHNSEQEERIMAMKNSLEIVQQFYPEVQKVNDAKESVKLEIRRSDVKAKARKDYQRCAVAEACKRSMRIDGVIAMRSTVYLIRGKEAERYILPESVTREIVSFDRGASFEPGIYRLLKPWAGNKMVNKYPPQKTKRAGLRGKRVTPNHQTTAIRAVL